MDKGSFPWATRLFITADAGGYNDYWLPGYGLGSSTLPRLSGKTGLDITSCHFPPGTSQWGRTAHRMLSFISMNWRGRGLYLMHNNRPNLDHVHHMAHPPGRPPPDSPKWVKITDDQLATVPCTAMSGTVNSITLLWLTFKQGLAASP